MEIVSINIRISLFFPEGRSKLLGTQPTFPRDRHKPEWREGGIFKQGSVPRLTPVLTAPNCLSSVRLRVICHLVLQMNRWFFSESEILIGTEHLAIVE